MRKKEYELTQKIPTEENGYKNPVYGVSYDDFVTKIIPKWLDNEKGINLDENRVADTCYFLWVDDTPVGIFKLRHYLNDWLRDNADMLDTVLRKNIVGTAMLLRV